MSADSAQGCAGSPGSVHRLDEGRPIAPGRRRDHPAHLRVDEAAIERSLASGYERLSLDRVDIVHVHDPDNHMDEVLEAALPLLRRMQAEGAISRSVRA